MATVQTAETVLNLLEANGSRLVRFRFLLSDATEYYVGPMSIAPGVDPDAVRTAKGNQLLLRLAVNEVNEILQSDE